MVSQTSNKTQLSGILIYIILCLLVFLFCSSACAENSIENSNPVEKLKESDQINKLLNEYDFEMDIIIWDKMDTLFVRVKAHNENSSKKKFNTFLNKRVLAFMNLFTYEIIDINSKVINDQSVFPKYITYMFFLENDLQFEYTKNLNSSISVYENNLKEFKAKGFDSHYLFSIDDKSIEFYTSLINSFMQENKEVKQFYDRIYKDLGVMNKRSNFYDIAQIFWSEECVGERFTNGVNDYILREIFKRYLENEEACETCTLNDIAEIMVMCDRPDLMDQALEVKRQKHDFVDPKDAERLDNDNCEETDKVFTVVEQSPIFPGGSNSLENFIKENLNYPDDARKNNVEGRVIVSFIVEKDGSLNEITVRSNPLNLETIAYEARRVVEEMPNWNPGFQNDCPIRVQVNLPIHFQLDQ